MQAAYRGRLARKKLDLVKTEKAARAAVQRQLRNFLTDASPLGAPVTVKFGATEMFLTTRKKKGKGIWEHMEETTVEVPYQDMSTWHLAQGYWGYTDKHGKRREYSSPQAPTLTPSPSLTQTATRTLRASCPLA